MSKTSENALEQTTLSWFESLGWQPAFGPNISPDLPAPGAASQTGGLSCERKDYDQVALRDTTRPMALPPTGFSRVNSSASYQQPDRLRRGSEKHDG